MAATKIFAYVLCLFIAILLQLYTVYQFILFYEHPMKAGEYSLPNIIRF